MRVIFVCRFFRDSTSVHRSAPPSDYYSQTLQRDVKLSTLANEDNEGVLLHHELTLVSTRPLFIGSLLSVIVTEARCLLLRLALLRLWKIGTTHTVMLKVQCSEPALPIQPLVAIVKYLLRLVLQPDGSLPDRYEKVVGSKSITTTNNNNNSRDYDGEGNGRPPGYYNGRTAQV